MKIRTIREFREDRGWSQFELAGRVGVTPSAIYNWERGRNNLAYRSCVHYPVYSVCQSMTSR
jgi:transcriptional regulator with XRE-family HTH domain